MKVVIRTPDGKQFDLIAQQVVAYTDAGDPVAVAAEGRGGAITAAHAAEGKSFDRICAEHRVYRPRPVIAL